MVRRIVEEDVDTPTTVVESEGSWLGRTIVTLIVIALLVVGTVWLIRSIGSEDGGPTFPDNVNTDITDNDNRPPTSGG